METISDPRRGMSGGREVGRGWSVNGAVFSRLSDVGKVPCLPGPPLPHPRGKPTAVSASWSWKGVKRNNAARAHVPAHC